MGTALAQIIADELDAPWDDVTLVQAIGHPRYGDQNTDGSRSIRWNLYRLRIAGAAMRTMLEQAGAARWGVEPSEVWSRDGVVYGPGRFPGLPRRLSYGALAAEAGALPPPSEDQITLKDPGDWRYIGKAQESLTIPQIVRGEGAFGMDVRLPDMLYAVVARPPQVRGKLIAYDDAPLRCRRPAWSKPCGCRTPPIRWPSTRWAASRSWRATAGRPCKAARSLKSIGTPGPIAASTPPPLNASLWRPCNGRARRAAIEAMWTAP